MPSSINLGFIFGIFFLTLGPLKLMPVFASVTSGLDMKAKAVLALQSACAALVILAIAATLGVTLANNWHVAAEALLITAGVLLFAGSLKTLQTVLVAPHPVSPASHEPDSSEKKRSPVMSPLTIPGIITPWGLMAVMIFISIASDQSALGTVVVTLLAIMALNIVCMIFAATILRTVGLTAMSALGWVFSILQAALGITFILHGIADAYGLQWLPNSL